MSVCVCFRPNRDERPAQMEHHNNSGWDECHVSWCGSTPVKQCVLYCVYGQIVPVPSGCLFVIRSDKVPRMKVIMSSSRFLKPFASFRATECINGQLKPWCFSVSFSLLILTLMNLGLFLKLWAMEDVAHRMYLSTKHRLRERSEARSDNYLLLCNMHI